uniref:Uncharacterized protein n=1 Tax=Anopheles quadriannulatus TaxID=34691 RepID=A0A182X6D7_ANOQN
MPSQPYDLVKDDQDIRVPLYPEQAFYGNGLTFQAKGGGGGGVVLASLLKWFGAGVPGEMEP